MESCGELIYEEYCSHESRLSEAVDVGNYSTSAERKKILHPANSFQHEDIFAHTGSSVSERPSDGSNNTC